MTIGLLMALFSFNIGSSSALPEPTVKWSIAQAERRLGIPSGLLLAICTVESGLRAEALNKSDGKAQTASVGLCQLKLSTARLMGYQGPLRGLYKPGVNAHLAGKYLRWQHARYGNWIEAVAAYNAGRVNRDHKGRIRNARYLERVMRVWKG